VAGDQERCLIISTIIWRWPSRASASGRMKASERGTTRPSIAMSWLAVPRMPIAFQLRRFRMPGLSRRGAAITTCGSPPARSIQPPTSA